jgi:hypothetical protein
MNRSPFDVNGVQALGPSPRTITSGAGSATLRVRNTFPSQPTLGGRKGRRTKVLIRNHLGLQRPCSRSDAYLLAFVSDIGEGA